MTDDLESGIEVESMGHHDAEDRCPGELDHILLFLLH